MRTQHAGAREQPSTAVTTIDVLSDKTTHDGRDRFHDDGACGHNHRTGREVLTRADRNDLTT